ncbi:PD40 domain-containing protein [Myxococcus sp. CA039A]|uniref:PD40 domain-containing protein n=1 Tax=Myxococcus sp. CA039A TaxID=2741737 RepID=UPI00157A5674|nr:PD40 domain-containing protein [Myxococcus sp. CA039A]NTX57168.1 PD40 domain-containing protein [Myxococcus sp. CA039A]
MDKRVVGALCCALWVLSSGCADECVDQFDCRADNGQPAEGQEWVCTADNECEQRPIPAPPEPDAGEPDAGEPDAGVPDAGEPDAGVPDAGPADGGGQGTAGKGESCAASADCIAGLRCEGTPLTCQAQHVAVTGRDDAGVSKALVMRYDTPGMTALSDGDTDSRYPRWAPSGTRVSFAQGAVDTSTEKVAGDLTVRDVPLVQGQALVLADGGSGNTESFRSMEWEPSNSIAWVRQNGSSRSGISVVSTDPAGSVVSQATTTGAFPDWAPDGTTFVYNVTGEGLLTSSLGASPTPLANSGATAEQAHYNHVNSQLLFLSNPNNEMVTFAGDAIPVPLFRLYSLNVTGGGQPQLIADVSTETSTDGTIDSFIASPIWAPDGTWSAYVRAYYFKPTTGDAVLCGGGVSPCQTRPGNAVFLRAINPQDGTATGTEVRLADDGTLPSFSPDGRFVAFIKAGQLNVQQVDPATGAPVNAAIVHPRAGYTLQTGDSDDHRPRWQPR